MSLEGNEQENSRADKLKEEINDLKTRIWKYKTIIIAIPMFFFGLLFIIIPIETSISHPDLQIDDIRTSFGIALSSGALIIITIDLTTKREYVDILHSEIKKAIPKDILPIVERIDKNIELKHIIEFDELKNQLLTDEDFLNKDVDVSNIKLDNYINLTNIGTKPGLLRSLAKHFSTFIENKLREEGVSDNDIETYKILCPTPEHNSYIACRVAEELKLPSVFVRERNKPGKGFYDGNIRSNDKFILLNDVTLTGGTAIRRIKDICKRYPNIEVEWAFAVFERTDEGANYRKGMEAEDIKFFSMEKIKDSDISDLLKKKDREDSKP